VGRRSGAYEAAALNLVCRRLRQAPCHKGSMPTYIRASRSVSEQAMAFFMSNACTLVWGMELK
jgi:hypothetical protein